MNKKTLLFMLVLIFSIIILMFTGSVSAQVWEGDYTITDSSDIADLSGYTEITGKLTISSPSLTNLIGLENLETIGGALDIENNDALTTLEGLDNLTSVGEWLDINDNIALTSISAFSKLAFVDQDLSIYSNTSLSSLNGLETLNTIPKDLFISENTVLISLTGLEGLTSVGGQMDIENNDALTTLEGLDNLTSVGDNLYIERNNPLTSLNGLENLTSVGGNLLININDALTNLCALYNVNIAGESLLIYENTLLSMETALALETRLRDNGFAGTSYILDNDGSGLVTCGDPVVVNIDLEDYELCLWDFSGTYTDSRDNMTALSYTLIQDVKGKLTGTGTFEDLSGGDNMTIPVEIKGKVKGKKSIVTLKYKVKGKNAEKDKIQNNLKLELVEDNETTLAGTEKWKICQKEVGCEKIDDEGVSLDVPDGMTGEAVISIISFDNGTSGKELLGKAELILSNDDVYDLDAKGEYKSKKDVTKYSLKGDNETAKGIKFKLKIDGEDNATQINGKALGQQLKYKLQ